MALQFSAKVRCISVLVGGRRSGGRVTCDFLPKAQAEEWQLRLEEASDDRLCECYKL